MAGILSHEIEFARPFAPEQLLSEQQGSILEVLVKLCVDVSISLIWWSKRIPSYFFWEFLIRIKLWIKRQAYMYCNFILAASCLVCDCSFKHTHSFRHTNRCLAFLKVIHFNTQSAFVVKYLVFTCGSSCSWSTVCFLASRDSRILLGDYQSSERFLIAFICTSHFGFEVWLFLLSSFEFQFTWHLVGFQAQAKVKRCGFNFLCK